MEKQDGRHAAQADSLPEFNLKSIASLGATLPSFIRTKHPERTAIA
jgi:hypothetical protein